MSLLVLCSFIQLSVCLTNQTKRIIPTRGRISFPKTHEKIIVPVDPVPLIDHGVKIDKPVSENPVESNVRRRKNKTKYSVVTEAPVRSRQSKRNPESYDDGKGNYRNSNSYVTRSDNPRSYKDANRIQPLHIDTKVFKNKRPQLVGNEKPPQDDKNKIKLEHLPVNPTNIPATSWFDNTGKYFYGIVHDENFTEPPEYMEKQQQSLSKETGLKEVPRAVFKSSFRDPKKVEPLVYNDGLGNFLYKSEIHYPSYRNHLYPPVITYGVMTNPKPATKELPTENSTKKPHQAHPKNAPRKPQQTRRPQVASTETEEKPREKPTDKSKQTQTQPEEEEDYDEDSSEDDEDGPSNDRYDGEAPGSDGKLK